jgi:hypothetical protein
MLRMQLSTYPDVGFSRGDCQHARRKSPSDVALLCSCDPTQSSLLRLCMHAPPSRLVHRWFMVPACFIGVRVVRWRGRPHSLQDVKSFVGHVLCENCDGDDHVPDDSCGCSPEDAILLFDGAGLGRHLMLAPPSGRGPHSTPPDPPQLLNLPMLRSLLTQGI